MFVWLRSPQPRNKGYLLLDRDGVLNANRADYIKSFDEVSFYRDALDALRFLELNDVGVILVSNQSGINRGLIGWESFWQTHEGVIRTVEENGGSILAAFYCPHRPDERCECRKPAPTMITEACRFAGISPDRTFFIGDSESDMEAAENAGCRGLRVCREDNAARVGVGPSGRRYYTSLMDVVSDLYPRKA